MSSPKIMKSGWKPAGQEQTLKSGVTWRTQSDSSKALVWFQQKSNFPDVVFSGNYFSKPVVPMPSLPENGLKWI